MRLWDLRNWRPPSEAASSRGYRTHGRKPAVGYCQRCREGVYVPEKELRRCPGCARDVCADCRTDAPEIESQICLDCARARRAAKGAYRRSLRFFGFVALAATAIVVGRYVALNTAWSSIYVAAAAACAVGALAFAWFLGTVHPCPFCEGKARVRRRRRGFREYQCRVCGQVWKE